MSKSEDYLRHALAREGDKLAERFWLQVDKDGPVVREDIGPCWLWAGSKSRTGYGRFHLSAGGKRRAIGAHCVAWLLQVGPIPEELELDHLCRMRACVNPTHLEPVTHAENVRRGLNGQKTHCPKGHPYDESNTITRRLHGEPLRRECKACKDAWRENNRDALRAKAREYHAANQAEINRRQRESDAANRDEVNSRRRANRVANRDEINRKRRASRAMKRAKKST